MSIPWILWRKQASGRIERACETRTRKLVLWNCCCGPEGIETGSTRRGIQTSPFRWSWSRKIGIRRLQKACWNWNIPRRCMENMFRFEFRIFWSLRNGRELIGARILILMRTTKTWFSDHCRARARMSSRFSEFSNSEFTVLEPLREWDSRREHGCNVVIPSVVARRNKPGQILQRYIVMVCYNEAGQILQRYNTGGLGADDSKSSRHGVSPFRTRWRKFTSCYAAALSDWKSGL